MSQLQKMHISELETMMLCNNPKCFLSILGGLTALSWLCVALSQVVVSIDVKHIFMDMFLLFK